MEIRVLRYFLTVVREETITNASEILHITQPTLSRQLAQLEEQLGVQLFIRGKRKITLTDEGMLLRRRAEEIVELADETEKELSKQEQLISGEISIGCGELSASSILPKLFESFSQKYPHVRYDLYTGNADQIKERMDKGLIDIGLLLEPVNIENYDFIRLNLKERWVVLMRPDQPLAQKDSLTVKDIYSLPLIMSKRRSVQNEISSWFGDYFDKLNIIATHNMIANSAILVESGLGYALTLEGAVSLYNKDKVCYRPLNPELIATSVLAWKKHQTISLATTKFINHAKCLLSIV